VRRKELEQAKRTNIRSVAGRPQKRQEEGRPDIERRHWVFACDRFTPVKMLLTPEEIKPLLANQRNPDPVECLLGEIEELDLASWPLERRSSPNPFNRSSADLLTEGFSGSGRS
jgi:hypothetical protein